MLLFRSSSSNSPESSNGASVLTLLGGTNAGQAPQVDYTQHVFLPFFRNHFLPSPSPSSSSPLPSVELEIKKRGYYPKGGGEVNVRVQPLAPGQKLRAVNLLERGRLVAIRGLAHYAGLPKVVGNGMYEGALKCIQGKMEAWAPGTRLQITRDGGDGKGGTSASGGIGSDTQVEVDIEVTRERNELTKGAGSGIVVWAEFENGVVMGGSAVGKKGLEPVEVGRSAVEELFKGIEAGGCVEEVSRGQTCFSRGLSYYRDSGCKTR